MRLFQRLVALAVAMIFAAPASAGTVEYKFEAESPTLGRAIPYAVYRPFPFPPEGERWPVVYLLHGLTGAGGDWFTWGNLAPILDQAIAEGRIPPLFVVAPSAGDSWYVDNPDPGSLGLIDTAFATDLIAAIDKSLPTAACREGRAIGGFSMGGAGALLQVMNHPETYVAAMSLSGALHRPFEKGDLRRWIPDLYKGAFGEPFDAARFNAANVFTRINALRRAKVKPDIYLTIGDNDYPDLIEASAMFHNQVRTTGVRSTLRIGAGPHYWETVQQAIIPALEWLAPKLDATCGRPFGR